MDFILAKEWEIRDRLLLFIKRRTATSITRIIPMVIHAEMADKMVLNDEAIIPMIIMDETHAKDWGPVSPSIMGGGTFIFLGTV